MCLITQSACISDPALRFKEIVLFIHMELTLKIFLETKILRLSLYC